VVYGDWDNPYGNNLFRLYTDKQVSEEEETANQMTERLAFFIGLPAALLFALAVATSNEILVWVSVSLFVAAATVFAFDQM
jgi:hypothetical protein